MQQTYLGRSGLVVSELCLGTMTFGGAADQDESAAIVGRFRDAGGTFFDTADVYTGGRSEEILGELLRADRDEVVLATKASGSTGPGPNDRSSSRRHLLAAVEASLRRLGTDWIDLYQLHSWDGTTPLDETLSALDGLVRAGKVRYVGISNFVGWQLERACRMQDAKDYDGFVSLQPQYSLVERQIELETLPAAHANGLGILAWSPLAAGFLTGKYARDETAEGRGRFAQFVDNIDDQGWDTLDAVRQIADARGSEPATVAVGWVLAQPFTIPIIGATQAEQLDASLAATGLRLGEDELARLTRVSEPARGYPWDFPRAGGRPERELRTP
ncbi:MAG TPA: aldo/keto reductase [Egibacteraceae bacterium]|nr:aldo/keto reductase [Egibacteraceae bacterium]